MSVLKRWWWIRFAWGKTCGAKTCEDFGTMLSEEAWGWRHVKAWNNASSLTCNWAFPWWHMVLVWFLFLLYQHSVPLFQYITLAFPLSWKKLVLIVVVLCSMEKRYRIHIVSTLLDNYNICLRGKFLGYSRIKKKAMRYRLMSFEILILSFIVTNETNFFLTKFCG